MSFLKKIAAGAVAAGAALSMMPAKAVIVGGIDFGAVGSFAHLETTTIAATITHAAGDVATSYGLVSTINGDSSYCADGSSNCALYFVVTNTVSAVSGSDVYFSGSKVTVYYSNVAAANLLGQDSLANLAFITSLTKWVTLKGANGVDPSANGLVADTKVTQSLTGATISAAGAGLLSVDLAGPSVAGVAGYLDANTIPTFTGSFADIAYTESANNFVLNPFDLAGPLADSCFTTFDTGDWCLAGSADLRGRTVIVPTPGSIGLLGLGLLGIAAIRRRTTK